MDVSIIPERNEIPEEYTWDLRDLFPDDEAWTAEFQALTALPAEIAAYAGTLGERPGRLLDWLKLSDEVGVRLEKLLGYASRKSDQDIADGFYQDMRSKAVACYVGIAGASAFATPELLAIPDDTLDRFYAECPALEVYRRSLTRIRRMRPPRKSCWQARVRWPTRRTPSPPRCETPICALKTPSTARARPIPSPPGPSAR